MDYFHKKNDQKYLDRARELYPDVISDDLRIEDISLIESYECLHSLKGHEKLSGKKRIFHVENANFKSYDIIGEYGTEDFRYMALCNIVSYKNPSSISKSSFNNIGISYSCYLSDYKDVKTAMLLQAINNMDSIVEVYFEDT